MHLPGTIIAVPYYHPRVQLTVCGRREPENTSEQWPSTQEVNTSQRPGENAFNTSNNGNHDLGYDTNQLGRQDQSIAPQSRLDSLALLSAQMADGSSISPPNQLNSDLNALAQSQTSKGGIGTLLSQGPIRSQHHASASAQAPSTQAVQHVDDGDQGGSYGTLMLSKNGSRYLGPTAGSEWLKDVRNRPLFGFAHG